MALKEIPADNLFGETPKTTLDIIKLANEKAQEQKAERVRHSVIAERAAAIVGATDNVGTFDESNDVRYSVAVNAKSIDEKDGTNLVSLLDFVDAIVNKNETKTAPYKNTYFKVSKANQFYTEIGINGEYFTIRAGVILRHIRKDYNHYITSDVWSSIALELNNLKPIIVEEYKNEKDSYRLWLNTDINGSHIVIGVDIKNAGRDIYVNAISTVFAANKSLPHIDKIIYPKTIEEKQSVLTRLNYGRYPVSPLYGTIRPNSVGDVNTPNSNTENTRASVTANTSYMQARLEGDYDAMRETLDDVAMRSGYPIKVYHGTRNFGFTVINPELGDDGFSFFTTTSVGVASTYSGTSQVRAPHEVAIDGHWTK